MRPGEIAICTCADCGITFDYEVTKSHKLPTFCRACAKARATERNRSKGRVHAGDELVITCSICGATFDYVARGSGKLPAFCSSCLEDRVNERREQIKADRRAARLIKREEDDSFLHQPANQDPSYYRGWLRDVLNNWERLYS